MAACSYLLNRRGCYYFRISIPKSLQERFQAKELVRSLKTKHLAEAKEFSTILLTSVRELFKLVSAMADLTTPEIHDLSRRYFHEVLFPRFEAWRDSTRKANRFEVLPSVEYEDRRGPTVEALTEHLIHPAGYPEGDFLFTMANDVLKRYGVNVDVHSLAYKELTVQGMDVLLQEMYGLVRRVAHSQPPEIRTPWLKASALPPASLLVSQLFTKYDEIAGAGHSVSMKQAHKTALTFWVDVFGDEPIREITREKTAVCEEYLRKLPKAWNKIPRYRGRPVPELLAMDIPANDRASAKTINDRISIYAKIFQWAIERGYFVGDNPFKGLGVPLDVNAGKESYTLEQLRSIFASPIYAGCSSESRRAQAGDVVIWDGLYWLPLMALLTGARMNELCQLYVADVRQQDGIWVFDINADGEDKSLKTIAAKRLVPIHSKLIELGLLDYRARVAARGSTRLFPDIRMSESRDKYSGTFTRKYSHYIETLGLDCNGATFHSFRHNVAGEMRRLEVRMDVSKAVIGHTDNDVHARYGGRQLEAAREAVELLNFGIDWGLLMAGKAKAQLKEHW